MRVDQFEALRANTRPVSEAVLSPSVATHQPGCSAGGESSAAGPVASGTESRGGPENARRHAHHRCTDPAAEYCSACGRVHQRREQPVPCRLCRQLTFDVHGICAVCRAEGAES